MSAQNVEVVRTSLEHFLATGEFIPELTHEDVEARDHDIMDGSEYRGLDGIRRWVRDWAAAWSSFSFEPEEYIDHGECVVVFVRAHATGASSGIEIDRDDALVYRVTDGKIARVDYYNNRAQARQAAGI